MVSTETFAQRSPSMTFLTAWVATSCETGVTMIG